MRHSSHSPILHLLTLLFSALLLTACAIGPSKPNVDFSSDYNFSRVKRIGFYAGSGQVTGDNPMQLSDIQKDRIHQALVFALGQRGFAVVSDARQADLLLSWHLVTRYETSVSSVPDPMPYGPFFGYNAYAMYDCWSCMAPTDVISDNYTAGTFIVDMIDPALRKSVWRASVKSILTGNDQLRDQAKINQEALTILASFPPGGGAK